MKKLSFPYGRRRHAAPVPAANALVAEGLTASYPGARRPAVSEIGLRIPPGARVALIGPNGSGKSSLLKAIAGLLPLQAGIVRIYGNPIGACHHRVAYLPQRGEIDWHFPISVERLVLTGHVHLRWLRRPGGTANRPGGDGRLFGTWRGQIGRLPEASNSGRGGREAAKALTCFARRTLERRRLATCEIITKCDATGRQNPCGGDATTRRKDYDRTIHLQDGPSSGCKTESCRNAKKKEASVEWLIEPFR